MSTEKLSYLLSVYGEIDKALYSFDGNFCLNELDNKEIPFKDKALATPYSVSIWVFVFFQANLKS